MNFTTMSNTELADFCWNWQHGDGSKEYSLDAGCTAQDEAQRRLSVTENYGLSMGELSKQLRKMEPVAPRMFEVNDFVQSLVAAHSNDWSSFQQQMNSLTHLELKCAFGALYARFQYMNGEI
jgi:hypothetical protein